MLVVETRTPELLNHVQLISVEPDAPESIPQVKTPLTSVLSVQPGVLSEATRTPPLVMYSPPPASWTPAVKVEVAVEFEVKEVETTRFVEVALVLVLLVAVRFVIVPVVPEKLVATRFVVERLVEVALVLVLLVEVIPVIVAKVEKRLVMVPVVEVRRVAKRLVEVALVVVALVAMKRLNIFIPEKLLLSERRVEEARVVGRQTPFTAKQPVAMDTPPPKDEVARPVTARLVVVAPERLGKN